MSKLLSEAEEPNPLIFWVAYLPGKNGKKNYLSDGKGNLRIFKSEGKLREYLKTSLQAETYERIVCHSVQGMIALPEPEKKLTLPPDSYTIFSNGRLPPLIRTLSQWGAPTAGELLVDRLLKKRVRRHKK